MESYSPEVSRIIQTIKSDRAELDKEGRRQARKSEQLSRLFAATGTLIALALVLWGLYLMVVVFGGTHGC